MNDVNEVLIKNKVNDTVLIMNGGDKKVMIINNVHYEWCS